MGHRPGKKINMSNKYKVMVGSYNLEFTFGADVTQQAALNSIKNSLYTALTRVTSSSFNDGEIVTNLVRYDTYGRSKLITNAYSYSPPQYTNIVKLTYENYGYKLQVWGPNGIGLALYNGSLSYFDATTHVPAKATWEQWKDKNVRFTYMGGSTSGEKRIVKVSAYEDGSLKGVDLAKGEFRQFKTDKIKDIVEVKL